MEGLILPKKVGILSTESASLQNNDAIVPSEFAILPKNDAILPTEFAILPKDVALQPQNVALRAGNGALCEPQAAFWFRFFAFGPIPLDGRSRVRYTCPSPLPFGPALWMGEGFLGTSGLCQVLSDCPWRDCGECTAFGQHYSLRKGGGWQE